MSGIEQLKTRREKLMDLIVSFQKKRSLTNVEIKEKNHLIMQVWELDRMIEELQDV